jgi:hypothetical protein
VKPTPTRLPPAPAGNPQTSVGRSAARVCELDLRAVYDALGSDRRGSGDLGEASRRLGSLPALRVATAVRFGEVAVEAVGQFKDAVGDTEVVGVVLVEPLDRRGRRQRGASLEVLRFSDTRTGRANPPIVTHFQS